MVTEDQTEDRRAHTQAADEAGCRAVTKKMMMTMMAMMMMMCMGSRLQAVSYWQWKFPPDIMQHRHFQGSEWHGCKNQSCLLSSLVVLSASSKHSPLMPPPPTAHKSRNLLLQLGPLAFWLFSRIRTLTTKQSAGFPPSKTLGPSIHVHVW